MARSSVFEVRRFLRLFCIATLLNSFFFVVSALSVQESILTSHLSPMSGNHSGLDDKWTVAFPVLET